jgi:hypothetical protein
MQALPIVEPLNELKHRRVRFFVRMETPVMNQLVLQRAEDAFDHRTVVTVAFAAHTWNQALLGQQVLVGPLV